MIAPHPARLRAFLTQLDSLELPPLAYPQLYPDRALVKLFLYALVHNITSFQGLWRHLLERPDVLRLVGLAFPPSPHHARQALAVLA